MPARRPLLLVTRRSAPRPARRLTPPTSTRVSCIPKKNAFFLAPHRVASVGGGAARSAPIRDPWPLLNPRQHADSTRRNSPQAGPPRHWYLKPCHVHPELVRQRHLRARRHRGLQACCLQQEVHHLLPGDPDLVSSPCHNQFINSWWRALLTFLATVSVSSCLVSWPSTPCLRARRPSPSTLPPRNKRCRQGLVFLFLYGHRMSFGIWYLMRYTKAHDPWVS